MVCGSDGGGTNLSETDEKQLMVGHSQRGQRGLLAVLLDPVHVSLSEEQTLRIRLHTNTHTHICSKGKWAAAAARTGRKWTSAADIFQINADSLLRRTSAALICRAGRDLFSFMETMSTRTDVTAFRGRRHLSPPVQAALRSDSFLFFQHE